MTLSTDVRVMDAKPYFHVEETRHGISFGRQRSRDLTLCHVRVRVETRSGRQGFGWGAVFLSHAWAMPQLGLSAGVKDELMRRLVGAFCRSACNYPEFGHPLQLFSDLMPVWREDSQFIAREFQVDDLPRLASLVCASPLDGAIHDGFGNANGIPTYGGYGSDYCSGDLETIDVDLRGRYVADYLLSAPRARVVIAHTVGLHDPLSASEMGPGDPSPLTHWIERDGVHCFKVKVGQGLLWDVDRLADVYGVAMAVLPSWQKGVVSLSADFNGQAPSPDYVVELLHRLRETSPGARSALDYVEEPTSAEEPLQDVTAIAKLSSVILDESFTDVATLRYAKALGWSGIALKTCKCQSLSLLAAAEATRLGLRYTVQDLSNPGIALLQSTGLASRLVCQTTMEANGRQYYPYSSDAEAGVHPGIFHPEEGSVATSTLTGAGLGYRVSEIGRDIFQGPGSQGES
jgi:L-alanine-DL-glutamate epimerase-like enolase superfamily enzyme